MTDSHQNPEEEFDQWLDDLTDGLNHATDDVTETASRLHQLFGVPTATGHHTGARQKAAIRSRILPPSPSQPVPSRSSGSSGIIAGAPLPNAAPGWWHPRRAVGLLSAAILVLFAIASVGVVLRLGDTEQAPGVSATASMMPFAPSSALASPTPVAGCATDDTLLLIPREPIEPDALADLPFPVAWYQDGTLTVQQVGEVIREIEIGPAEFVRPTPWPDVAIAYTPHPATEPATSKATLVNLATGTTLELGPVNTPQWTDGPFMFWASDEALYDWHVLDLRTFEQVSLTERFNVTPAHGWFAGVEMGNSSIDGTVLLVTAATLQNPPQATPQPSADANLPELRPEHNALLIDGGLDRISVVGPLTTTSGAMTLSPDGDTIAWLAPYERAGVRVLTIAETATGEVIHTQHVQATYNNDLLFSADGSVLYSTVGQELHQLTVNPDTATPVATDPSPIPLPGTGYEIGAATPDRSKLLLSRPSYASDEISVWLDLETGETREYEGTIGRLWESTFPTTVASDLGRYVLLDDLTTTVRILDMATGEIVTELDRQDGGAAMVISTDASALIAPHLDSVDHIDLVTGATTTLQAPESAEGVPQLVAVSSDGDCTALSWQLENGSDTSLLLSANTGSGIPLPPATIGGWTPSGGE